MQCDVINCEDTVSCEIEVSDGVYKQVCPEHAMGKPTTERIMPMAKLRKITVYDDAKMLGMYLDWFNNFMTVKRFAEYYNITEEFAETVIFPRGRELLNRQLYGGSKLNQKIEVNHG